jgi:hypothetical protein
VGERVANGGKLDELVAGGGEEVLNVLLAAVQKLQAGFVRERALLAARSAGQPQRGDDEPSVRTHIFCAVSAPFDFFSYCASMACCSCLTIFACRCRQHSGRSAGEPEEADLLDGKLLVRLDLDLARLFQRLLLDERDLNSGARSVRRISCTSLPIRAAWLRRGARDPTILFISVTTSSSFIGRDAIVNI